LTDFGVKDPDLVDDVILNLLPKYYAEEFEVSEEDYASDIARILQAYETDSKAGRLNLIAELREANFLRIIDAGDDSSWWCKPGHVYISSDRLKTLFDGVSDIYFVDSSNYECLRGEKVREMLEACGAARTLQPLRYTEERFTYSDRAKMRKQAGAAQKSSENHPEDWTLRGLEALLEKIPNISYEETSQKASLLWEALCDMEERRGQAVFSGVYKWSYYTDFQCYFDAYFVHLLNKTAWVPTANGELVQPSAIVFDAIEPAWKPNAFLISKILFKSPAIEALEREVGFGPGTLELLKQLGLTSVAELREKLGLPDKVNSDKQETDNDSVERESEEIGLEGIDFSDFVSIPGNQLFEKYPAYGSTKQPLTPPIGTKEKGKSDTGTHTPQQGGNFKFTSYIAVNYTNDEGDADPDGLQHEARMSLEREAINAILLHEPNLNRTPVNNPGFDLYEVDANNKPIRLVEVKAMTGSLLNRPVTLSRMQFEMATKAGRAYWLYVVENALSPELLRIVKIQDPSGKACSFTFDAGWKEVAEFIG